LRRVLIIGATGFLGSNLYSNFLSKGIKVVGTGRMNKSSPHITPQVDILNKSSYIDLIKNFQPNIVIVTAWYTKKDFWYADDNYRYYEAYIELFKCCYENGVEKIIGFGTAAEYGDNNLSCESGISLVKPANLYGKSKLETGLELGQLATKYERYFLWLRLFQVYGIGERQYRLVPTLLSKLKNDVKIRIDDPNKVLDWIHIEDVVSAVNFLLSKKQFSGILDIGTAKETSVKQIVDLVVQNSKYSGERIKFSGKSVTKVGLICSQNIELFKMNWKPKIDVILGIKRILGK
jgi:nucleoside-diphosphate-sugar epimerase